MEEVIVGIIEKSLIGGAFLYMLRYFLGNFSTALESVGSNMQSMSETLLKINYRLDSMERRMDQIEKTRESERRG